MTKSDKLRQFQFEQHTIAAQLFLCAFRREYLKLLELLP